MRAGRGILTCKPACFDLVKPDAYFIDAAFHFIDAAGKLSFHFIDAAGKLSLLSFHFIDAAGKLSLRLKNSREICRGYQTQGSKLQRKGTHVHKFGTQTTNKMLRKTWSERGLPTGDLRQQAFRYK